MSSILSQVTDGLFTAIHGDCVEAMADLPSESVGLSIFSPPFSHLFIYSDSERDMGNASDDAEFLEHYRFLVRDLFRVTKPGRLCVVHCSDLPRTKSTHGEVALYDLPGDIRAVHEAEGWTYHSRVTIWKDPVVEMQRTKALGLLHKSVRENAAMCRQGIPDYLITVRAPGECERVTHGQEYPVDLWQKVASPVWMDINPSDTLQYMSAREHDDERHIAPLQLEVIRRGVMLWTNPDDIVLSPFMGIGSEGYVSLEMGRRFVGVELKASYYRDRKSVV